jgi:hypothetical protein
MAVKGETKVVRDIKEKLTNHYPGCFFFKVNGNGFQRSGIPDLIGCINGRFIGLEVKDPKNKSYGATKLQLHIIELIKESDGIAGVVRSFEEAKELIDNGLIQTPKSGTKKTKRQKKIRFVHGARHWEDPSNDSPDRDFIQIIES